MNDDLESYSNHVRADHYLHWFAVITAGVWVGTNFGWVLGLGVIVGLQVAISITNTIILARSGSFRAVRISRWAWVLIAFMLIVVASTEVQSAQT